MRNFPLVLALALVVAGCGTKPEASGPPKEYALRGEIVRLDADHKIATIKHEKIEGWMEAMTMEFPVKDAGEFAKLKPGQKMTAKVYVKPDGMEYWIGEVKPE